MMFGKSLGLALVLAVAACGGESNNQQARAPETQTTTTGAHDTSMNPPTDNNTSSMNGGLSNAKTPTDNETNTNMTQQNTASMLTDAQIAAITDAANKGEIEQAKLAIRKAKDPQVKAYAQMMVDHHGTEQKKEQALATSLSLQPESTQTSTQIQTDSQSAISSLTSLSGADFDKAYIDLQVKEHKEVLDAIDTKLLPAAKNAQLKQALTEFRPKVADHLQKAEELQKKMTK